MASVSWTQTTGGSWFTPGAWSTGADPLRGDDVTINTPTASITVTYSTGSLALDSLTTGATDTLSVTGGTLSMANGYNIQGALLLSAGLLRLTGGSYGTALQNNVTISGGALFFANSATALSGTFTETAGTITIAHGVFNDTDSGAIGGTITGAGELLLSTGGTTTLKSGAALSTGAVDITNGTVLLQEKLGYAGDFSLTGTLDLNGNSGTLTGFVGLDGDINGGSLILSGSGHLNAAILDNGAELTIQSSINETGNVQLGGGSGTGTLNVTSAGTLRIAGNDGLTQGQNAGMVINAGLIEKVAGNSIVGTSYVFDAVNNTGIIDAAVGTIDFRGPGGGAESTINGTLMGAGTIAFDNGDYILGSHAGLALDSTRLVFSGSTSVTLASALSYGGNWVQNGGLLLFENALTLSGTTDFDGGELKGTATITDSGPLTLGTGMDLEGNLSFAFDGNVDQTGAINLGQLSDSVDQATLAAGELWVLEGASSISGAYGTITNDGSFVKLDGAQNSIVASTLNNNGNLLVETGTLSLTGQGTLGGSVGGSAVLDISGQFTLASGVALSVGELILDQPAQYNDVQASLGGNLTFANDFAQEGGTLALNGNTLTLSGIAALDSGAILGSGEVLVTGAATIINVAIAQGGTLQFDGATEQSGNVTLTGGSSPPALTIGTGGVYTMDNGVNIGGPNNSVVGTITVGGTLIAAGSGLSTIAAAIVDNGSIQVSHGQMQFLGPLSGGGAISLTNGGILDLDSTNSIGNAVTFGAGSGLLYLQNPSDYTGIIGGFGAGDAIELNGFAFLPSGGVSPTVTASGHTVTISEPNGPSLTLTFTSTQSTTSLMLGMGPHGGLALIHL